MDSDDKILRLIDFEASPEKRDEAINYLQKLRTYKVENLKKDVVNLQDDLKNLDLQTQEIAFSNYQAFIKTAESSRKVLKGWNETTKNVENLIEKVPELTKNCDEFVKIAYDLNTSSRLNALTMKKHIEILEILELPQLMEMSIREEKYADALELANYVEKLSAKFNNSNNNNVPIINSIAKTIESSWHVMITQLLSELKCDLTLPKCLQIVGYLRRMQAFSTQELKLKFLQARDNWFKELLASIPKNDPFQHLTKTIEVTRVNLFNIITQYKALFDDDFSKDTNSKSYIMFCSWIHDKIDDFLKTLDADLTNSNCTLMDIASTLGQCMYFGVSFSRIGLDFRAELTPIFIKCINKYLSVSVKKATKQFESDMESFTLINKEIASFKRHLKAPDIDDDVENNNDDKPVAPPESLLDFQPLAIYCNALINIFNELRTCAPLAILHPFVIALENSLECVSKAILNFYRSEQQAFGLKEKENFLKMCSSFAFEFIPYIQLCINVIFPPPTNNKLIPSLQDLATIRTDKVLDAIEHLLPDHTSKI
jgi:hypothetical protein